MDFCSFVMSVTDDSVTKRHILEELGPQPLRLASHRTLVCSGVKLLQEFSALYLQSNTTIFHLVVQ